MPQWLDKMSLKLTFTVSQVVLIVPLIQHIESGINHFLGCVNFYQYHRGESRNLGNSAFSSATIYCLSSPSVLKQPLLQTNNSREMTITLGLGLVEKEVQDQGSLWVWECSSKQVPNYGWVQNHGCLSLKLWLERKVVRILLGCSMGNWVNLAVDSYSEDSWGLWEDSEAQKLL